MRHFQLIVCLLVTVAVLLSVEAEAVEILNGNKKPVQRIVSLAPSCTEIIAGLNLTRKLVGITQHTDYPEEVLGLPDVGSYVDLNLEAIVSLKPDLVVATDDGNPHSVLQRLKEFSIAVFVMNLRSYQDIQESILALGTYIGAETEAMQQVDLMRGVAHCIRTKTADSPKPSVLFVYESYPIVTAGAGTFTDELIEMAGGRSITHDVKLMYPRLTVENVLAKNPDVIIESTMDPSVEKDIKLRWWKQWPGLKAVERNRVHVLDSKNLDRPSQRIVYGFLQLAKTLHPNLIQDDTCLTEK